MFLSVIIPHYELPRELLERCIASIIAQQMPADDYEIIVVDDGSSQPPAWTEETYPDINIRLIAAAHGGPGAARNRGIDEARGTYIEFVDADDMIIPGNNYAQCLNKLHGEKPQILHFNYHTIKPGTPPINKQRRRVTFSNTISGARYMKEHNLPGSPCCYFFQRELAIEKNIRFPENIFHEDEEFNTILHFHARTLVYSDATLYHYCIRKGSTTANSSSEFETRRINDILHIIKRLARFRSSQQGCNSQQSKGFEHKFTMLGVDAILNMMYNGMSATEIIAICREHLTPLGLYPLPEAAYSMKYRLFRQFANSERGMSILRRIMPYKKPAKQ